MRYNHYHYRIRYGSVKKITDNILGIRYMKLKQLQQKRICHEITKSIDYINCIRSN
jgi:hypothetical protein